MESTSFYITLPSNASMEYYSNNTASCYQIRLPRTIYLKGRYEVALAEIQYPHTWETFNDRINYRFSIATEDRNVHHLIVPQGYYSEMDKITEALNDTISKDFGDNITFIYNPVSGKVKVYIKNDYVVNLSHGLADILGFKGNRAYTETTEGPFLADIQGGFNTLFVYCSICESQIVGDAHVPLLRTVYVEGTQGQTINKIYDSPHYVPVNTSKFDTIEINIKNDMDELVSFQTGKVLCKLHFRQRAL